MPDHSYRNEYKGKTVLITGGAGCIGSNLTKALIQAEASKIIVLDDLSAAEKWNIPVAPSVQFLKGSILDEEVMRRVFSQKLDFVFHLAAHFANQNSVDNPETDLTVNGMGTLRVLEYSRLAKVGRVVFASSGCSVYGNDAPLPLKEDFVSIHLDTPYQITKLLGELYCNFYHNHYGLPVGIARYFNVYGPGEIPGLYRNVIPIFMWRAMHALPLIISGTGEETRDFTYVDDIVDGTLRIGVIPEAVGQAFNLASETETKISDLAGMVQTATGYRSSQMIQFIPRRDWDKITRRRASIEKARLILGYEPVTHLRDGVMDVYYWMRVNEEKIESCARF